MLRLSELQEDNEGFFFQIVEQDGIRDEFHEDTVFEAGNGWRLLSYSCPEIGEDVKQLWVRGLRKDFDEMRVYISDDCIYRELLIAVDEYNATRSCAVSQSNDVVYND